MIRDVKLRRMQAMNVEYETMVPGWNQPSITRISTLHLAESKGGFALTLAYPRVRKTGYGVD
jgi:hypothetical protein